MKRSKRFLWLQERVAEQQKWIERCGGDLAGYVARYGDPGIPPLDKDGIPRTIQVPDEKLSIFREKLQMVSPGIYYALHSGDGGTAIYKADLDRLHHWQREFNDLQSKFYA